MKEKLYDAAIRGDAAAFSRLLEQDPNLLDRTYLNCEDKNVLHISAMMGNEEFVRAILQVNSSSSYDMCLARDRDGRNPVHLAAIHGKLNILNLINKHDVLIQAALEKVDRGGTILHLCVKHNRLEPLELLLRIFTNSEFVSAKNEDGMTILHLAIYYNQYQSRRQIIAYLTDSAQEIVHIKNSNGKTALDLLLGQAEIEVGALEKLKNSKRVFGTVLDEMGIDQDVALSLLRKSVINGQVVGLFKILSRIFGYNV